MSSVNKEITGPFPYLSSFGGTPRDEREISRRMLDYDGSVISDGINVGLNLPFTTYMKDFLASDPDVYLFTANSAIPVADSVRGVYDEIGGTMPEMRPIFANSRLSASPNRLDVQFIEYEVERLKSELSGSRTVVIDQYTDSGRTIRLAEAMLFRAGVMNVGSTHLTKWYEEADVGDLKCDGMTSGHATLMRSIGRTAGRRIRDLLD